MAFRDDKLAMKLRIEQLEGELATANETIARLKGHADARTSDEMSELLTKERLHLVREVDAELDDSGFELVADMLRQRLPNSQISMIGQTLHCKWGTASLRVLRHPGRTELVIDAHDPRSKVLNALGGFGFAVLGSPLVGGAIVGIATALGVALPAWLGVALAPLALLAGYLAMDQLTRRTLRNNRTSLRGALEAAIALTEEHGHEREPVRIDVSAEAETEAEAEAEAEATADADADEAVR